MSNFEPGDYNDISGYKVLNTKLLLRQVACTLKNGGILRLTEKNASSKSGEIQVGPQGGNKRCKIEERTKLLNKGVSKTTIK